VPISSRRSSCWQKQCHLAVSTIQIWSHYVHVKREIWFLCCF
jgi:hypothetical protein